MWLLLRLTFFSDWMMTHWTRNTSTSYSKGKRKKRLDYEGNKHVEKVGINGVILNKSQNQRSRQEIWRFSEDLRPKRNSSLLRGNKRSCKNDTCISTGRKLSVDEEIEAKVQNNDSYLFSTAGRNERK